MANKERTKRSARKARQKEREELEAARIVANQTPAAKATKSEERTSKAPAKKKGFFAKTRKYFSDVRSEMHRVVWPTKAELRNYTVGVISMLIVFAVSIFLIDNLITWLLTLFAGLKG